jgi:hypothetical protein
MKLFLLCIFLFVVQIIFGQVYLSYTRNLDIYKPYTALTQEYMKVNDKIFSSTQSFNLRLTAKTKTKFTWDIGLSYKQINHLVEGKILGYYKHFLSPSSGVDYYYLVNEKLDLKSNSNSLGLINQFDFVLKEKNKLTQKIGFSSELYAYERFFSIYVTESGAEANEEISNLNLYPLNGSKRSFFMSSFNFACHYLLLYKYQSNFSLATKISLGTNLYSDWDQFKKYVWLGVGLELGFGNKPLFKQKEK